MSTELKNCVRETITEPPGFLLSLTSGVMQFYPWLRQLAALL